VRILVADDEALVRYGLVSVLRDILSDPPIIIEAANGRQLVEQVRDSRPHIGFVDIRMPKMEGLEAIAQASRHAPNTLWVVLTGHADFGYAQTALKLGVEDFILKPVDPAELKTLMDRLKLKVHARQRMGNRELEAKVAAVLGDTTSPGFDPYFEKPRFWQAAMVVWDSLLADDELARRRREFAGSVVARLDTEDEFSGCAVSMKNGALLIVLSMPAGGMAMDRVIDLWHRRIAALRAETADLCGDAVGDTWLLTRVVQDAEELFGEVDDLDRDAVLRFVRHPGVLMEYGDFCGRGRSQRFRPVAEILEDLRTARDFGTEADFHGLTHRLLNSVDVLTDEAFVDRGPAWYARYVLPIRGTPPESLEDLARRIHDESHVVFTADRDESDAASFDSLAARAVDVMERRFRESIGIADVAEELGVSPNYLSTLFKKETGVSFTRRLTGLRLEASRRLLSRPDANIGEVARSLGYQSGRHFTRLFKEEYGRTPSEWIAERRK